MNHAHCRGEQRLQARLAPASRPANHQGCHPPATAALANLGALGACQEAALHPEDDEGHQAHEGEGPGEQRFKQLRGAARRVCVWLGVRGRVGAVVQRRQARGGVPAGVGPRLAWGNPRASRRLRAHAPGTCASCAEKAGSGWHGAPGGGAGMLTT